MSSIVKRCSVAAVLALAALMPDFRLLNTSPDGLALIADLVLNTERRLAVCVPVTMPQSVYDALVSFSFNVGTGAACRSTLVSYIKRHQWWQACDQLTRWVFVNGTRNKGLENRRARELAYCMKGVTQ